VWPETDRVKTLALDVEGWPGHRRASMWTPPDRGRRISSAAELLDRVSGRRSSRGVTVERIDDGEVSPYLTGDAHAGDGSSCAVRRGYFVWDPNPGGSRVLSARAPGVRSPHGHGASAHREPRRGADEAALFGKVVGGLIYRNELGAITAKRADGLEIVFHPPRVSSRRAGRVSAGGRPRAPLAGRCRRSLSDVRVRPPRSSRPSPRRSWPRTRAFADQDRALRPDSEDEMKALRLDGNAAAGLISARCSPAR